MRTAKYLATLAVLASATAATSAARAENIAIAGNHANSCHEAAQNDHNPRSALRDCNSALNDLALAPAQRAATFVNRGIVQMRAHNVSAAIADYDAAIATEPATAEAWINKGIAFVELGGRDIEAAALLTEGLARNPARPALAYYQRAIAYETLGRVRDAYEDYARAAALEPAWEEPARQLQRFKVVRGKTLAG